MAHTDGTEDAVVSDVGLPGISLGMALVLIRRYDAEQPVVIVSGNIGEAGAVTVMKAGAQDYVLRGDGLSRLVPAIEREVIDARQRRMLSPVKKLRRSSERQAHRLAAIVEASAEAIFSISLAGRVESWNRGVEEVFGYSESEIIGRHCLCLMSAGAGAAFKGILERVAAGDPVEQPDAAWERRDGSPVHIPVTFSPVRSDSVVTGASIIARDITYRRNAGGTGWPCPAPSCSIRALRPGPEPTVRPGDPCS